MTDRRLPVLLLVIAAGAWAVAHRPRTPARWLQVEAPRHAVAGQPLPLRVTLVDPPPGAQLVVDLHGESTRREPLGFLAAGGARPVTEGAGSYEFAPLVPEAGDLGAVTAIVFLSRSGRWADRTAVAASDPIPIGVGGPGGRTSLAAYDPPPPARPAPAPVPALRLAIGALWLLAAARLARTPRGALALACAAAAAWELANLEGVLVEAARSFAREHRLYHERSPLQEAATIAILLAAAALAARRRRPTARARATGPLPLALWLYAGVVLASLLSWHEADRLLGASVLSVPAAQAAKLAAALTAVAGAPGRRR